MIKTVRFAVIIAGLMLSYGIASANQPPVLDSNVGTSLSEGATALIPAGLLRTTDVDNTPSELVYTVETPPTLGTLSVNGVALFASDTFTQADIDNELLTYAHGGGGTTDDSFTFTVTDGLVALPETLFQIRVNPVGTQPTEFKLIASDRAPGDQFGVSVSLDGDRALIGSYLDDDEGTDSGSAYVFVNNSTGWALEAKLTSGGELPVMCSAGPCR